MKNIFSSTNLTQIVSRESNLEVGGGTKSFKFVAFSPFRSTTNRSHSFGSLPRLSAWAAALLWLLLFVVPRESTAQEQLPCETDTTTFTGQPEPTLCQAYGGSITCDPATNWVIGAGTAYPNASAIGSSITGVVCIVGNFLVDVPFTFENAIVKINPSVAIDVAAGPNPYSIGATLVLDNAFLFACNDLWKGIRLGLLSTIHTMNGTQIEDAETAIFANSFCALSIELTTFNRDRVGIELINPFPNGWTPGPTVWVFQGNNFTCTAPLNGTLNEITDKGVKLKDALLYSLQSQTNTFTGIQHGIYAEGTGSYIGLQNLVFRRIRRNGIYMEHGNLNLRASFFLNNHQRCINIKTANRVSLSGDCVFRWDNQLPLTNPDTMATSAYDGIYLENFALASRTDITGNRFLADLSSVKQRVVGINCKGSSVGGGTFINITHDTLHFYGGPLVGVLLNGNFPSTSQIYVYGNNFDVQNLFGSFNPIGIQSLGHKHNFGIQANSFYNRLPENGEVTGMILSGSVGTGNHVSDNQFIQGTYLESFLTGVEVAGFLNTKFCSNNFANTSSSFSFAGLNYGTVFAANFAHGPQLLFINGGSLIEEQEQQGNQWTPELNGFVFASAATPQAECVDPLWAPLSRFLVHTPQSTTYYGPGSNSYHPRDITPDVDDEWWKEEIGIPKGCDNEVALLGAAFGDTEAKRAVANGSFAAEMAGLALAWQAARAVYFALKQNPALENAYPAYSTFKASHESGNIGKLYQVATALDAAQNGDAAVLANAQTNQTAMDNLLLQLEAADQSWQNAVTPAEKEAAKTAKLQKMVELMGLLSQANTFQTSYKQGFLAALPGIQQTNEGIIAPNTWEGYEKSVNSILLNLLQNGMLSSSQIAALESIANLCPKEGGMAVYQARTLLPKCTPIIMDRDNYPGCYPMPGPLEPVEMRSTEGTGLQALGGLQLFPNPATETATMLLPEGKEGFLRLFNPLGKLVLEQRIMGPQTSFRVNSLPAGLYSVEVFFNDGMRERLKLLVSNR